MQTIVAVAMGIIVVGAGIVSWRMEHGNDDTSGVDNKDDPNSRWK
jgi:hypothetical protein